ncbi:DUF2163 domain-containing protein [Aliiroseovarius sp. KMU-50]|uniref:DUF2163 domain-containing protein n=1 Tax=Aliiroseovarius salicola TaxID=3009082 RepID=A0ABT4W1M9_9RHOB|nr:DUF2163 domain-containing protein [Aliiroseovarius sp. KMU-50]MDA5094410.1 DUF2163 domain-containing protein [Aliiroseovarius sp. KMU-50]
MPISTQFATHLGTGVTSVARCWVVRRKDGETYGFTDHDRDLMVGPVACKADTGLTAHALEQTTGLAVDNTEALGALRDAAISEKDIRAGRFDGAEVEAWLVNWQTPSQNYLQFRGSIGEISRENGAFRAELVGLSEALNRPQGRAFQKPCTAVLGDRSCKVDLNDLSLSVEAPVQSNDQEIKFVFSGLTGFEDGWFERGRLLLKSGEGQGLSGLIRKDEKLVDGTRKIVLWEALRADVAPGDQIRLEAGCDKRVETCRTKFANLLNHRGFPTIPGEDWLMSYPVSSGRNDGRSLA